jgi:hypothetical protein
MKNKKSTYILLLAVVAVWGAVVIRIINHIRKPDDDFRNTTALTITPNNSLPGDTIINLRLDYSDPFLKYNYTAENQSVRQSTGGINIQQRIGLENKTPEIINWPDVKFNGIISNKTTNEKTGLIEVNNQSYLVKKGDLKQDIQILEVYADSVLLSFKSQQKTITKTTHP